MPRSINKRATDASYVIQNMNRYEYICTMITYHRSIKFYIFHYNNYNIINIYIFILFVFLHDAHSHKIKYHIYFTKVRSNKILYFNISPNYSLFFFPLFSPPLPPPPPLPPSKKSNKIKPNNVLPAATSAGPKSPYKSKI